MFYYQSQIESIIHCQNCGVLFHEPKLLPCGESICETCLKAIELSVDTADNKYICPLCNAYHEFPEDGYFITNRALVQLLKQRPIEFVSDESMLELKQIMNENLKKMADLEKLKHDNGADRVNEYCQNVKKEIKTATMRIFDEVFKQHSLLLGTVEDFHKNCLKYLDMNPIDLNVNYLIKEVKNFEATWRNSLNKHRIDKKEIVVATEEACKLQHKINHKVHELNDIIFNNKTCEFSCNENPIPKNIIGK